MKSPPGPYYNKFLNCFCEYSNRFLYPLGVGHKKIFGKFFPSFKLKIKLHIYRAKLKYSHETGVLLRGTAAIKPPHT